MSQCVKSYLEPSPPPQRTWKPGPPIIGEEAWSKIPKFRSICSDKFSKIFPNVFGLPQAFAKIFKFCLDGPSGLKNGKFVRTSWSGLKKELFFRLLRSNSKLNHSPPIPSAFPPWPFLGAATIALTAIIISWSFPCSSLKIWRCLHQAWVFSYSGWVWVLHPGSEEINQIGAGSKCPYVAQHFVDVPFGNSDDSHIHKILSLLKKYRVNKNKQIYDKFKIKYQPLGFELASLLYDSMYNLWQVLYQLHHMFGLASGIPVRATLCSYTPSALCWKFDP